MVRSNLPSILEELVANNVLDVADAGILGRILVTMPLTMVFASTTYKIVMT